MKLNFFKKKNLKDSKSQTRKLDKEQLEKVIGGAETVKAVATGNADAAMNLRL